MTETQSQLIELLQKASLNKGTNTFEYKTEWLFDWPSQSINMLGKPLHEEYSLPREYSIKDLNELERMGFIVKVNETKEDKTTLEKTVVYKIE